MQPRVEASLTTQFQISNHQFGTKQSRPPKNKCLFTHKNVRGWSTRDCSQYRYGRPSEYSMWPEQNARTKRSHQASVWTLQTEVPTQLATSSVLWSTEATHLWQKLSSRNNYGSRNYLHHYDSWWSSSSNRPITKEHIKRASTKYKSYPHETTFYAKSTPNGFMHANHLLTYSSDTKTC